MENSLKIIRVLTVNRTLTEEETHLSFLNSLHEDKDFDLITVRNQDNYLVVFMFDEELLHTFMDLLQFEVKYLDNNKKFMYFELNQVQEEYFFSYLEDAHFTHRDHTLTEL